MTKAHYLAIDPGHMCGYALFDKEGNAIDYGQFPMAETVQKVNRFINLNPIEAIICEDYVNYVHGKFRQTGGGRNETSKVIGQIEAIAEMNQIPIHLQHASKYEIGAKWGGFTIPSNHSISHQFVATAHGVFWLQTNGIREAGRAMKGNTNE